MAVIHITSHSSGPADAGRLTPALYKTQRSKHENPDRLIPGFVSVQFCGLFFEVVISEAGKIGGNFNLSVSFGWLYFQVGF